jgi:hypothetical protein
MVPNQRFVGKFADFAPPVGGMKPNLDPKAPVALDLEPFDHSFVAENWWFGNHRIWGCLVSPDE